MHKMVWCLDTENVNIFIPGPKTVLSVLNITLARAVRKFCNVFSCSLILGSLQENGKQQKLTQVTHIMYVYLCVCVCVFVYQTHSSVHNE